MSVSPNERNFLIASYSCYEPKNGHSNSPFVTSIRECCSYRRSTMTAVINNAQP